MTTTRLTLAVTALVLALAWLLGPAYLLMDRFHPDLPQTVVASALLSTFGITAWLTARAAPGDRAVRVSSGGIAVAAATAAVGNLVEDALHVTELGEAIYFIGLIGLLATLVVTAALSVLRRRPVVAVFVLASTIGLVSGMNGGPPVLALVWLAVLGQAVARGRIRPGAAAARSS